MATVEQVLKDVQSFAPPGISMPAAATWLNNRYREMVSKVQFRSLRKVGELIVPGQIDTGTVTATRGSTSVTGASTTFQTEISAGTQEHYWFRARSAWYKIASVTNETTLVLSSAFAEDSVSAVSYNIVKRTHALASDARWLGKFVLPRNRRKLESYSEEEFDLSFPGRILVGSQPEAICEAGEDSNGYKQIEVYPFPEESEIIRYVYWALPTDLTISATIPTQIDHYVLKEGVMIDIYRAAKIKQIEMGNVEAAAIYANEEAKQRTIWKKALTDALRSQRGVDDVTFIIESFGGRKHTTGIRTAREDVLSRWSY